ncbi:hypothetical protein CSAL01_12245 [Colletotrichum salicis]|uniref:DNA2/NAM7 helicase-like C-terminal domain-containing protein n=1 Tax=Colletotrichum salicis TaxID=1209931 RepID=A0A135TK59_9PEZI|nr:hypothetical protein CSAL01_12245 [Colletotrichum salicis]
MRLQLRMANGVFDIVGKIIYPTIPVRYSPICNIDLPEFEIGHRLESHFRERFPELLAPAKGKFAPIFVHCKGTKVQMNPVTGSKRCPVQVRTALNLANDFVTAESVEPSKLVILSPSKPNVELLNRWAGQKYPDLAGMRPASTINGYQGKESDIVFVVIRTKFRNPGPGFTQSRNRLNVLLTRQRCGLVIVGDINVVGPMEEAQFGVAPHLDLPAIPNFKLPKAPKCWLRSKSNNSYVKDSAPEQYAIWLLLWQSGRVATISVNTAVNDPRQGIKRERSDSPAEKKRGFFAEDDEEEEGKGGDEVKVEVKMEEVEEEKIEIKTEEVEGPVMKKRRLTL